MIPPEDKYGLFKLQSAVKKDPAIQPIPVHVWNRLTRQRLEQLCVRINNFHYAHLQLQKIKCEFQNKISAFSSEELEKRFQVGDSVILSGITNLTNYTGNTLFELLVTPKSCENGFL